MKNPGLIAYSILALATGGALLWWRKRRIAADEGAPADADTEETMDDTKTPPADPAAWRMLPQRFPAGVTYQKIVADNAKARSLVPAGYGTMTGGATGSKAGARAQSLLHSMEFGTIQYFIIDGVQFAAIKEWHAPHVPPVGPPHQWHPGVSVFEKKAA